MQDFYHHATQFLKLDEEFRKNWRYKHRQDAIKEPRRQAMKSAKEAAENLRQRLELTTEPLITDRYAGKAFECWEKFVAVRNEYFDTRSVADLQRLKSAEKELKTSLNSLNAIIKHEQDKQGRR